MPQPLTPLQHTRPTSTQLGASLSTQERLQMNSLRPVSRSGNGAAEYQNDVEGDATEESLDARVQRLGRERPGVFLTAWSEVAFVFSIIMSQLLTEYFVSGFTLLLPTVIRELDIPQASTVWPATAFSLVIASTLMVFGRLGDMFGGYPVFIGGLSWLLIWSIITGFSTSSIMLNVCRALQGLGAAAALPTGIQIMGSTYRSGPRKNLVFAIYGFFGGIFFAGLIGQYTRWGFYFWIGAIMTAITLTSSSYAIRPDQAQAVKERPQMDYLGAMTIVIGLVLLVLSITQSAHATAGWRTPYILVCFILAVISLSATGYVEARVATHPLLPASIFCTPSMTPLLFALLLLFGSWGIFSVYGTLYFQNIMSASPLQVVAWYVPLGVAGLLLSILEGFILHLVPARLLLGISGLGALGSQLLLELMPGANANYWAWIFPATILSTIGIDLSVILMTVFITTTFPSAQQGLAGGVLNSVLQLGVALTLGLTDIVQSATVGQVGLARSYKNTFWFGIAVSGMGLILMLVWGRIPKATSELSPEEKAELVQVAEHEGQEGVTRSDP
ncbi:hypothetical protein LTR86_004215 [Recurvomyces mirabilis]|nr:hypothetical protein LTR86_004215 [Recurvomyces mirabilis]